MKQRIRHRIWYNLEELQQALQEEYAKVTIQEIRARIAEMPARCQSIVDSGGKLYKSKLW